MGIIFWFSTLVIFSIYLGYPLVVTLWAKLRPKAVRKGDVVPSVSILISAYNEEKHLERKIDNSLAIDYPREKLEIIVISDASTDGTHEILKRYAGQGIRYYVLEERRGKTAALNKALEMARGEILFFTDATTIHPPEVLKRLVRNFCDPEVGCVSGKVIFRDLDANLTGKGLKARLGYEIYLRHRLSDIWSMFGATGCIMAIRKGLCQTLREDLVMDLVVPLLALQRFFRTVYEPEALAFVDRPTSSEGEFNRRSRIVLRGLRALVYMRCLGNPFRYGVFVSAMFYHRLLRWLAPVFFIIVFISSLSLVSQRFYLALFLIQVGFYLCAVGAHFIEEGNYRIKSFRCPTTSV